MLLMGVSSRIDQIFYALDFEGPKKSACSAPGRRVNLRLTGNAVSSPRSTAYREFSTHITRFRYQACRLRWSRTFVDCLDWPGWDTALGDAQRPCRNTARGCPRVRFLPSGTRLHGKIAVLVRCHHP